MAATTENYRLECWHGVNSSPEYYPFEECERVLIPFNLVFEKKIKLEYVQSLQVKGVQLMIDSGAAYYYLNTDKGYPEGYLAAYLDFLEQLGTNIIAFALDSCFEKEHYRNNNFLEENFRRQLEAITKARTERGLILYPVVQGWDRRSYQRSAREVKKILKCFSLTRFGIGSICRASIRWIRDVLGWVGEILPLDQAHCFGITQRAVDVLKRKRIRSVDSSNASGNAGHGCICNDRGEYRFHWNSNQGKRKHQIGKRLPTDKRYRVWFKLNKFFLEKAFAQAVPLETKITDFLEAL